MDKEQVLRLIQVLEEVRDHLGVFLGRDFLKVANLLDGFYLAATTFGPYQPSREIYEQILLEHGFDPLLGSRGSAVEMLKAGVDPKAIAKEMLSIEIEALQKMLV